MAGSKSNQFETDVLKWGLTADAVTRPSAWYVALFTDAAGLGSDQPSSEANSTNCPGYTRQQVTSWTVSGDQATNNQAVIFTATGSWATVRYFGIFDASTGGRLLYWGDLSTAETLADTNKLEFGASQLTIGEE